MGDACPLCLDELGAARLTVTPCGHAFCGRCLSKWTATHHTCPLCRSALPVLEYANSPSALTTRMHSLAFGARVPGASRALPTRSLQSEVEQAERLREESRARRSTLQRRIDGYHAERVRTPSGKSPGATPHPFSPRGTPPVSHTCHRFLNATSVGRRFESLPLISVAEMRELRRENKRNLLSTRSGLGHGLND